MIDQDGALKAKLDADRLRFLAMANSDQEMYLESARSILPPSLRADYKTVLFTAIQLMINDEYLQTTRRAAS